MKKTLFWIGLFGATINIALNFILIPTYSLYGVAIVRIITYFLIFILLLKYSLKLTTIRPFNLKLIFSLIGIIISSALMFFGISVPQTHNLHVLFVIMIGIVVYLICLWGYSKMINFLKINKKYDFKK